jgi:hypothetical protein
MSLVEFYESGKLVKLVSFHAECVIFIITTKHRIKGEQNEGPKPGY